MFKEDDERGLERISRLLQENFKEEKAFLSSLNNLLDSSSPSATTTKEFKKLQRLSSFSGLTIGGANESSINLPNGSYKMSSSKPSSTHNPYFHNIRNNDHRNADDDNSSSSNVNSDPFDSAGGSFYDHYDDRRHHYNSSFNQSNRRLLSRYYQTPNSPSSLSTISSLSHLNHRYDLQDQNHLNNLLSSNSSNASSGSSSFYFPIYPSLLFDDYDNDAVNNSNQLNIQYLNRYHQRDSPLSLQEFSSLPSPSSSSSPLISNSSLLHGSFSFSSFPHSSLSSSFDRSSRRAKKRVSFDSRLEDVEEHQEPHQEQEQGNRLGKIQSGRSKSDERNCAVAPEQELSDLMRQTSYLDFLLASTRDTGRYKYISVLYLSRWCNLY